MANVIKTFKDLFKLNGNPKEENISPFLSPENRFFTEFTKYKYYNKNIIGTGGNNGVYYVKEKNTEKDLAVKIEYNKKKISV